MKCEVCQKEHSFGNYDDLTPSQRRNLDVNCHHAFSEGFKGCLIEKDRIIEIYIELSRFRIEINLREEEEKKERERTQEEELEEIIDSDEEED
jgi:hypothetical protein